MMQHDHRRDARRFEAIQQMDIALKLLRVERCERRELKARPLDAHAIGIHAELRHPVHVLLVAIIMVAGRAAMAAVGREVIRPFVDDMALHLGRRRCRAPEKTGGKFQIAVH